MKKWIPLAGVAVVAVAAFAYWRRQAQILKDFTYKIIGVNVRILQQRLVEVNVRVRVTNDSSFQAVIERIYLTIFIEGADVGFVESQQPTPVAAKSNVDIDLRMTFDIQRILKNVVKVAAAILTVRKITYRLEGFVKVKSGIFKVTLPVDQTAQVNVK
jgi:LEA14-like dessication related protein